MKKATFRVDSSTKIGAGHLMRCLTIADELKKCGYEVTFICRNLSGNLISLINYKVIILPRNDNFESNLIRRVCGLLYVSDKDSGMIKVKITNLKNQN